MQIVGLAVLVIGIIVTLAGVFLTVMQLLRPPREPIPQRSVETRIGPPEPIHQPEKEEPEERQGWSEDQRTNITDLVNFAESPFHALR